mmetsp:Transcript_10562/g.15242  ORF Transcript_10562/g.15242 Transcript_10562/m.15242 type:complete len:258 (+) Transcript_10562:1766-2539(+)
MGNVKPPNCLLTSSAHATVSQVSEVLLAALSAPTNAPAMVNATNMASASATQATREPTAPRSSVIRTAPVMVSAWTTSASVKMAGSASGAKSTLPALDTVNLSTAAASVPVVGVARIVPLHSSVPTPVMAAGNVSILPRQQSSLATALPASACTPPKQSANANSASAESPVSTSNVQERPSKTTKVPLLGTCAVAPGLATTTKASVPASLVTLESTAPQSSLANTTAPPNGTEPARQMESASVKTVFLVTTVPKLVA